MRLETSPDYLSCRFVKETEEQFNNSGDLFLQAIENADGVPYQLVFGPSVGQGYYLNIGYGIKELLGLKSEEFTEELFLLMTEEIIPLSENTPNNPIELREKIISGAIRKYKAEILITTQTGEKKWISDSSVPVIDDRTGRAVGLTGIFFDISERKKTLIMLEKALERASESDRLKTAFLNNLPHEIRTPLNAIVGFSTLLGEPGQMDNERREFRDIITCSSDHLLEIVDDVVEISKIEAKIVRVIRKQVNLSQMMQRVYDRFLPAAAKKNVILRFDIPIEKMR